MALINRSTRSTAAEPNETPNDGNDGRRTLRRVLLLGTAAVAVGVGVAALRRRRPKREFTEIELDADPAEQ